MVSLTSWIPVYITVLLHLHIWKARVHASGTSEEDGVDITYVIIGVTLGAILAIGFIALKICMIKRQLIDNILGESEGKMERRSQQGSSGNREATLPKTENTNDL
ncbi:PREDICTED: putative uncharacterized protein C10orf128 homolog isoform X1 [Crocodylus porosus]|uniref:putative uncharacterized protein C10orf128 homolog isoform X1 n=1 Tax=Crocodylus porosus TaxID=8502 RepID=UPI00093B6A6F|nr:PREDICTED: putative uncharacterized protein C10orf128 homolog isoform X1 [Crocodylus porosus]XP_019411192.1 PREDICTED: putative uncharacterized protein C10orf128 homolog isoform X1 [Crocodylus porosus]